MAQGAIADGADLIALGEMGIGNSASAALLMHRLAPAPLDDCVGQGAGHSPEGMARKRAVLARAAARSDVTAPFDVLTQFGGYEIAMMAGALLAAARAGFPVLVDGFIGTAARPTGGASGARRPRPIACSPTPRPRRGIA